MKCVVNASIQEQLGELSVSSHASEVVRAPSARFQGSTSYISAQLTKENAICISAPCFLAGAGGNPFF